MLKVCKLSAVMLLLVCLAGSAHSETVEFDTELTGFGDEEIGLIRDKIYVNSHQRNYSNRNKELSIEEIENGLNQICPKCNFKFAGK